MVRLIPALPMAKVQINDSQLPLSDMIIETVIIKYEGLKIF